MSTYIVLALSLLLVLALSLIDARRRPKLQEGSPDEYLSHSTDYDLGLHLLFKELPVSKRFGLGVIPTLILVGIIVFLLCLVASIIDGTLTIPDVQAGDDVIKNRGFLEDYGMIALIIASVGLMYLFHRITKAMPQALLQLAKSGAAGDAVVSINKEAEQHLKKVASVIFQTKDGRTRLWIALEVSLGIVVGTAFALEQASMVWNPPESVGWAQPPYFWGNTVFLILSAIGIVYLFRVGAAYIYRLVWGMWYLGKALAKDELLHIEPLHPDNAGGLGEFGRLAWSIDLILSPVVILIPIWYVVMEVDPFFWALAIFCTVGIPVFFFVPLLGVHRGMADAKKKELRSLSRQFNRNAPIVRKWWDNEEMAPTEDDLYAQQTMERVMKFHERASHMPVWPFNAATLAQVAVYLLIPLMMLVIQQIMA